MRQPKWKLLGVALLVAVFSIRCGAPRRVPSVEKPTEVEVEGAGPLVVRVTDVWKRPLRPDELAPTDTIGFLWEYKVRIANQSNLGVSLNRMRLNVQNLWGRSFPGDQPLNLRIESWGEEQVSVEARLGSSDPDSLETFTGVETLTFLGRREDGEPISFTVRVPLH